MPRPPPAAGAVAARTVTIAMDAAELAGELDLPADSTGLILIVGAHLRNDPRVRRLAGTLQKARLGTLLLDLVTPDESGRNTAAADDDGTYNSQLLADRLRAATRWAREDIDQTRRPLGYLALGPAVPAAIIAATKDPGVVQAIVAFDGRLDRAGLDLTHLQTPILLLVGERNAPLTALHETVFRELNCPKRLAVIANVDRIDADITAWAQATQASVEWLHRHVTSAAEDPASS